MWYKGLWWLYPNSKAVVHPSYPEGVGGVYENKCLPLHYKCYRVMCSLGGRGGVQIVYSGVGTLSTLVFFRLLVPEHTLTLP